MKALKFDIVLDGMEGNSVAALTAPFKVEEVFGTRARVPVRGTINGYPFRSSLMPMGGCHRMVVNQTMRKGAGVKAGDKVRVVMERDTGERVVEVPPPLKRLLSANQQAQNNWEKRSFTHQKEMAKWITEAKRDDTRQRRLAEIIRILKADEKWPG
jgi:hypothetical protein